MEKLRYVAKGANGQLEAYEDKVVIKRKGVLGVLSQGIKGDRTIYYNDIKSVEYKKPTLMANGYIQFITNIELANTSNVNIIGLTTNAALKDPNTIILRAFKKENVLKYEEIKEFILEKISEVNNSKVSKRVSTSATEIKEFKELLDSGVITQEEFDLKKKQLLNL